MDLKAAADLDNEKRAHVLEIIDKLRDLGIGETVSLPQLVVVGDQSSGKSFLLEGLTGMSFPIASDLCTRFATQIVLHRAHQDDAGARITIIPGPGTPLDDELDTRLRSFQRTLAVDQFGSEEFGKIFDEAAEFMGLPGPNTKDVENISKRFSDDTLKIELSGSDQHHLSVVDVPGLFHNPTKYQTVEDRVIIRNLIQSYITDKRTIILRVGHAVMDARNNLANQEVFSMAGAADPLGKRTVGIITKCDAVEKGDEAGAMRIAKNQVENLMHGWFVVKNRSTKEIQEGVTIEDRHVKEQRFFSTYLPWSELSKDRVGIHPLKRFLGLLLYEHIRSEFPNVVKDVENHLRIAQKALELLGPPRSVPIDQRRFLTRVANKYQREVSKALGGNYDPQLERESPLKLRMHIRVQSEAFSKTISVLGHAWVFQTVRGTLDPEFTSASEVGKKRQDLCIVEWIRGIYRESRGTELPGTVTDAVKAFMDIVLPSIVTDADVLEKLQRRLKQVQEAAYSAGTAEFCRILKDERGGILQTVNHYFADNLNAIREERVRARLQQAGYNDGQNVATNLLHVMKTIHLSNEQQAVYDIHDILKAYYKVALKRFTDNVVLQVVERHILGPNGPVRAFSPDMVNDFDEGELMEIAGESFSTSSRRNDLVAQCERFEKALNIATQSGI
ncbi:P-loop containing nucleoside triphosphate hydrolase protein [Aspergillus germanicus]